MTSRKRKSKDTPTKSLRRRAVQKRKREGEVDAMRPIVRRQDSEPAGDDGAPAIRGEAQLRVEAGRGRASGSPASEVEQLRQQLTHHVEALRFVNGTLAVCVQALQQQNAELDAEIALVLQRTAGDKLDATTDSIEELALGLDLQEPV